MAVARRFTANQRFIVDNQKMQLFVEQLTNVDFSYLHPSRGILGETWLADVVLDGILDDQGMVCDFGIVKKTLRNWLDNELDHRLAIPTKSPHLKITEHGNRQSDPIEIQWTLESGEYLLLTSPREAIALVDAKEITESSVAQWCITQLTPLFPKTVNRLQLEFNTEDIAGAYYHYSHGLKKHQGNCQRIAHGHRSKIMIWKDGIRHEELEQQWAKKWEDIYLGTSSDIVETFIEQNVDYYRFAYTAPQGDFSITLPISHCDLMETDSTVEYIAQHIATKLKQENPQSEIKVRAFEGKGKGAVAE